MVATIGLPHAIASSSDVPSPSVTELITKMSNALWTDRTSGRKPVEEDVLLQVMVLDLPLQRRTQLAFAGDHEPRVRHRA